jgi:hypothetical protein
MCYLFLDLPDRAQPILEQTVTALTVESVPGGGFRVSARLPMVEGTG